MGPIRRYAPLTSDREALCVSSVFAMLMLSKGFMNDRNEGIDALTSDHASHICIQSAGGIKDIPLSSASTVRDSRRRCSAEKPTTLGFVRTSPSHAQTCTHTSLDANANMTSSFACEPIITPDTRYEGTIMSAASVMISNAVTARQRIICRRISFVI